MSTDWRPRIARAAILIVAAGLMLEMGLRAAAVIRLDSPCFIPDDSSEYRMRPGSSCGDDRANSLGFPDDEHQLAKQPGVTRVAFVGDSFVVGSVERDKTMVALVREAARNAGQSMEVFNLGLPSAGPPNYSGVVRATAKSLQLDTICVVWFLGDDILQSHPDFHARLTWRSPHEVLRAPYLVGRSPDYSYVYRALRSGWRRLADRRGVEPDATFARSTFLSIERQRLDVFARNPTPFIRTAYAGAASALQTIADHARSTGARLVVVLAPDEMQVDPNVANAVLSRYSLNAADFDFGRPARLLSEAMGTRRVEIVDLTPALREAAQSAPVYFKYNTHWNERGNQVAAETVFHAYGRLTSVESR